MKDKPTSVEEYIDSAQEERRPALTQLRRVILDHLPTGFQEEINYGMPGYVVPHAIYPKGYHCDPQLPLPFINFASQKNFIALYHMGIYANPELLSWFEQEYPKHCKYKLDMGKSCIRFKRMGDIPFNLIAELVSKMTVQEWVDTYERAFQK